MFRSSQKSSFSYERALTDKEQDPATWNGDVGLEPDDTDRLGLPCELQHLALQGLQNQPSSAYKSHDDLNLGQTPHKGMLVSMKTHDHLPQPLEFHGQGQISACFVQAAGRTLHPRKEHAPFNAIVRSNGLPLSHGPIFKARR